MILGLGFRVHRRSMRLVLAQWQSRDRRQRLDWRRRQLL